MNCSSSHAKHRVLVVVGSGSGELVLKGLGVSDKDILTRRTDHLFVIVPEKAKNSCL